MIYKLGKLPKVDDPRTLPMARYLDLAALPSPPPMVDLSQIGVEWGMLGNDHHADCTAAAGAHAEMIFTYQATGTAAVFTDQQVLDFYALVNGGRDEGAVEIDCLNAWRTTGIGGHKIHAFTEVPVGNLDMVKLGCWIFGGLYMGAAMPISAQARDGVWDVVAGPQGVPGSWGGHAMFVIGYDSVGVTFTTWGRAQKATWAWWATYVDEAYAILPEDFEAMPAGKLLPNGLDVKALEADLSQL